MTRAEFLDRHGNISFDVYKGLANTLSRLYKSNWSVRYVELNRMFVNMEILKEKECQQQQLRR